MVLFPKFCKFESLKLQIARELNALWAAFTRENSYQNFRRQKVHKFIVVFSCLVTGSPQGLLSSFFSRISHRCLLYSSSYLVFRDSVVHEIKSRKFTITSLLETKKKCIKFEGKNVCSLRVTRHIRKTRLVCFFSPYVRAQLFRKVKNSRKNPLAISFDDQVLQNKCLENSHLTSIIHVISSGSITWEDISNLIIFLLSKEKNL